jgi:hypothetical protein
MSDRHRRGTAATAVVEEAPQAIIETDEPDPRPTDDALYPVALLKIAMAMKKLDPDETRHFERLLETVLEDMIVDREDFRRYVQRNMGRLVTAVRDGDY